MGKPRKFIRKKSSQAERSVVKKKEGKNTLKREAKKPFSPNIYRSITERIFGLRLRSTIDYTIGLHAISILALLGLLFVGIGLSKYIERAEQISQQKKAFFAKIVSWESLAGKYSGFRDLDMAIAVGYYQLRDFKSADEFVEKSLEIDPNYLPALKLKGILLTIEKK